MSIRIPKYRFHKGSGQALVQINGDRIYLGRYGSEESQEKYQRLVSEWLSNGRQRVSPPTADPQATADLNVNKLILAYWHFAETYYSKEGKPTKELTCMREAIRPLRRLYGHTRAGEFGPKALKAVRQHMVDGGLSRGVVNRRVGRIKRVFKWAVGEELIPSSVFHGLQAVAGLRYGRTEARETEPIKPVPQEWVDAVTPHVSPPVAAMILLQWLTGMRPCEVVVMRPCDIDRSGDIWIYEPYDHKNRWRGHDRKIPLGPKAQEILKPFLDRAPDTFLFNPRDAEEWRHAQQRKNRTTPMTPSQSKRRPKAKPKHILRDHYDTASYQGAIEYGLQKANKQRNGEGPIPHWFPLQIRHSRGTEVRRHFGLDGAQATLGHARADVTEVYAEKNLDLAIRIAKEMG
jgi:integrase